MHSRVIEELSVGRFAAAVVAAALVLGACTNDPPADGFEGLPSPSESPTAAPSPTASAEAGEIDVTTTPDEITPEWVTTVVNTLLAEYGEIEAQILASPVDDEATLPPELEQRLDAVFDGERLEVSRTEARALVIDLDGARSRILPADEYEGLRFEVELVQYAQPTCIVAVGRVDRRGTIPDGDIATTLSAISLVRGDHGGSDANLSEWEIADILPNTGPDGEFLPDEIMLNATLADYAGSLEHDCAETS